MEYDALGLARGTLELRPYVAEWARSFEAERDSILKRLPNLVLEIEHVGSTSIPGLAAKPIIDMQAAPRSMEDSECAVPRLVELGYAFMPERVYESRIFLPKGPEEKRTHYLSLIEAGSDEWRVRLRFRDALRSDPKLRQEYEDLKRRLLDEFAQDRSGYTGAKSDFVARVLTQHPR